MNYLEAIIVGAVQGFTEFLPISSSGHLYLVETWLGHTPNVGLEVWLHVASLLAVLLFFKRDVVELVQGFFLWILRKGGAYEKAQGIFALKLGVTTLITFALAFLLKDFVLDVLSVSLIGATLVVTAFLVWGSEAFRPSKIKDFVWWMVPVLGIVQAIAIFPGISRSGITIACLILLGVARQEAARSSFLLAIPTILGAFVFTLFDGETQIVWSDDLLLAGVISFLSATLAISWMMKLIEGKWVYFAWYCLAVGGGILLFPFL